MRLGVLAEFWSSHPHRGFHPKDEPHIPPNQVIQWSVKEAKGGFQALRSDKSLQRKLHGNLFPLPYMGNLDQARVFILFGNPSLGARSYAHEHLNKYVVSLHIQNLKGNCKSFMSLDPGLDGKGGNKYWRRVFKRLAKEIASAKRIDRDESYALIAERVAVLEACAYRSYRSPGNWTKGIPSSKLIREFVDDNVLPRVATREALVLVWRRAGFWRVESDSSQIIVRNPKVAQLDNLLEQERVAIRQTILE